MTGSDGLLETLERRRGTVFLVAGGLLVVFAVNTGARTFLGQSYPLVQSFVAPAGFLVGVVGLLGLYPALADRTPMLARAAGLLAGITAVYWLLIIAGSVADVAGILADSEDALPVAFFVGVYVAMFLTYSVVGAVSLYGGVRSPVVGLLVLGPAAMFLLLMTRAAPNFIIDAGHALFHLGIGAALVTGDATSDQAERAPDSPA